ncbi:MAG: hypothetical protein KF678_12580 [Phycisphaeraceae bacterium]|nr:hypothetical protein [Phycisphaeraceae bacterium]
MSPESLTIHPPPIAWRHLLHHNTSPQATQLRRELDLPTDRPIIMTGHQPEFWHPGILAKYLAADAASAALNACPVWLFVDQDRPDSVPLHFPAVGNAITTERPALSVGTLTIRERTPPTSPRDPAPLVAAQLATLLSTLARHHSAPTLSHQIAATLADLARPYLALPHPTIFATQLSRTTLFRELVAQMARDPERCIRTYNAAAARHPSANIRPLTASDIQDRWELPLWHLPPHRPRTHVYAEDLPAIPPHELAPKALFMTGLLRLAACDLFIHGTGGAGSTDVSPPPDAHDGYDLITEEWFRDWLGQPLAPMTLVTATRYLPLADGPIPTPADLARARWLAHHARHSPLLLRDPDAALAKQHIVDQIELLPRHTRARADLFRRLHAALADYRQQHSPELSSLSTSAAETAAQLAQRDILFNRTWPFPLYPDPVLSSLRDDVRRSFGQ